MSANRRARQRRANAKKIADREKQAMQMNYMERLSEVSGLDNGELMFYLNRVNENEVVASEFKRALMSAKLVFHGEYAEERAAVAAAAEMQAQQHAAYLQRRMISDMRDGVHDILCALRPPVDMPADYIAKILALAPDLRFSTKFVLHRFRRYPYLAMSSADIYDVIQNLNPQDLSLLSDLLYA